MVDSPLKKPSVLEPSPQKTKTVSSNAVSDIRIFVSSPLGTADAQALHKKLYPTLMKWCNERGKNCTFVDFRDGGVLFARRIWFSFQEINRCLPFFYSVLSDKYGAYQDEDQPNPAISMVLENAIREFPWIDTFSDRSLCEIEIRHACTNKPVSDRSPFTTFYVNKTALETLRTVAVGSHARLSALVEELELSGFRIQDYTSLSALVSTMTTELQQHIGTFSPGAVPPLARPMWAQNVFSAQRCQLYVGGETHLRVLSQCLTPHSRLIVTGEPGSGKSALLANWAQLHKSQFPKDIVLAHYIGPSSESLGYLKLMENTITQIVSQLKGRVAAQQKKPKDLKLAFRWWLETAARHHRTIFMVDSLDCLLEAPGVHSLLWLPPVFSTPNLHMIISTGPGQVLDELKKRGWAEYQIKPLLPSDRKAIVQRRLLKAGQRSHEEALKKLAFLVEESDVDNPLRLHLLIDDICVFGPAEAYLAKTRANLDAASVDELCDRMLDRLEAEFDVKHQGLVAQVLGLVLMSHNGWLETEFVELVKLPIGQWIPLYYAIQSMLGARDHAFFSFVHDKLRQAVQLRYFGLSGLADLGTGSLSRSLYLRSALQPRSDLYFRSVPLFRAPADVTGCWPSVVGLLVHNTAVLNLRRGYLNNAITMFKHAVKLETESLSSLQLGSQFAGVPVSWKVPSMIGMWCCYHILGLSTEANELMESFENLLKPVDPEAPVAKAEKQQKEQQKAEDANKPLSKHAIAKRLRAAQAKQEEDAHFMEVVSQAFVGKSFGGMAVSAATINNFTRLQTLFSKHDVDCKGGLTVDEFEALYLEAFGYKSQSQIRQIYGRVDANCDSVINWDEFSNFLLMDNENPFADDIAAVDSSYMKCDDAHTNYLERRASITSICNQANRQKYVMSSTRGEIVVVNATTLAIEKRAFVNATETSVSDICELAILDDIDVVAAITSSGHLYFLSLLLATFNIEDRQREQVKRMILVGEQDLGSQVYQPSAMLYLKNMATNMSLVKDQRLLCIGDQAGTITLFKLSWTVSGLNEVASVTMETKYKLHNSWINRLMWVPYLHCVVSGSDSGEIAFFDMDVCRVVKTFNGHRKGINAFVWCPSRKLVVSGGVYRTVLLWEPSGLKVIAELTVNSSVLDLAMCNNDTQLAVCTRDTVFIYSMENYSCMQVMKIVRPSRLLFDEWNKKLVIGSLTATSYQVNLQMRKDIEKNDKSAIRTHQNADTASAVYNHKFGLVVTGDSKGWVYVWDFITGVLQNQFLVQEETSVSLLKFTQDDAQLVICCEGLAVTVWNFHAAQLLYECVCDGEVLCLCCIKMPGFDNQDVVVGGLLDGRLKFWAIGNAVQTNPFPTVTPSVFDAHTSECTCIASDDTRKEIASSGCDGVIILWRCIAEVEMGQSLVRPSISVRSQPVVEALVYLKEKPGRGGTLVSYSVDGYLCIWDTFHCVLMMQIFAVMPTPQGRIPTADRRIVTLTTDAKNHFLYAGDTSGALLCFDVSRLSSQQPLFDSMVVLRHWLTTFVPTVVSVAYSDDYDCVILATADFVCAWTASGVRVGVLGQVELWDVVELQKGIAAAIEEKRQEQEAEVANGDRAAVDAVIPAPGCRWIAHDAWSVALGDKERLFYATALQQEKELRQRQQENWDMVTEGKAQATAASEEEVEEEIQHEIDLSCIKEEEDVEEVEELIEDEDEEVSRRLATMTHDSSILQFESEISHLLYKSTKMRKKAASGPPSASAAEVDTRVASHIKVFQLNKVQTIQKRQFRVVSPGKDAVGL